MYSRNVFYSSVIREMGKNINEDFKQFTDEQFFFLMNIMVPYYSNTVYFCFTMKTDYGNVCHAIKDLLQNVFIDDSRKQGITTTWNAPLFSARWCTTSFFFTSKTLYLYATFPNRSVGRGGRKMGII